MMTDQKPRLLLVDDETHITNALSRLFRRDYDITCCSNGATALSELKNDEFAIIVSDMRMPQMDGATLLAKARELKPDTVRILLTGHSDMSDTIRAINEGQVFNYICKPWNNKQLKLTIKGAAEQYHMQQQVCNLNHKLAAKNQLLKNVNDHLEEQVYVQKNALKSSKYKLQCESKKQRQMFHSLLELINTIINERTRNEQGHNRRVAFQSKLMADALKLDNGHATRIYLAGLMADLGKVCISDELIGLAEQQLDSAQFHLYRQFTNRGADLLQSLPDLKDVAKIVKHQCEQYGGGGFPDRLKQQDIPIGSRILAITKDFDRLMLGKKLIRKLSVNEAKSHLSKQSGIIYDPQLVKLFLTLLDKLPDAELQGIDYAVTSTTLRAGTTLSQNVYFDNGNLFLPEGTLFTDALIEKIRNHEYNSQHHFTFFVY